MLRLRRIAFPALVLLIAAVMTLRADVIVTRSGDEIAGRIVQEDFEKVTLSTRNGQLVFQRNTISEIRRTPGGDVSPTEVLPVDPRAAMPPPGEPTELAQAPAAPGAIPSETTEVAQAEPEPAEVQIEEGRAAAVTRKEGVSLVRRTEAWEDAEIGMQLSVGNEIRTGEGRTELLIRQRGEVRLPQRSQIELAAVDDNGNNVTLNLVRGNVWVDIEPPDTGGLNFNVQTPDLTAGVRGTVFQVEVVEDEGSRINVLAGAVAAAAVLTDQTALVEAGFSIFCDKDGNLTAPEPIVFDLDAVWQEWESWAAETASVGAFSPAGGDVISGMTQLTAAEQQLHATMVAEHAANTNINRQAEFVEAISEAFRRYAEDVRDLPPSNEPLGADGWRALLVDTGDTGWRGPYLPVNTEVPVKDGWGNPITYVRKISRVGNVFGELVSNGPNGRFSQGMTDDIRVLIRISDEIQAELRARQAP
jgi:hypothetical protein